MSNEVIKHLVFEINRYRKQAKAKPVYRSKLGDCVAKALHESGCKSEDQGF